MGALRSGCAVYEHRPSYSCKLMAPRRQMLTEKLTNEHMLTQVRFQKYAYKICTEIFGTGIHPTHYVMFLFDSTCY